MLADSQLARRAAWLQTVLRNRPELNIAVKRPGSLRLSFPSFAKAERFHRALLAENMPARLEEHHVELRAEAWYSPADLQAMALAVAKVAYYLRRTDVP